MSIQIAHSFYDRSYYYGKAYQDYDRQNPRAKIAYYVDVVERSLAGCRQPRLLDFGCAFATFLAALPTKYVCHGVDVSEYALGIAQQRLPAATFTLGTDFPTDSGLFDAITAFDVLEHIPSPEVARDGIASMLVPGGRVFIVVPVFDGLLGPVVHKLDFDPTHVNKWSRQEWLSFIGERFNIEKWTGIVRYLTPVGYLHYPSRFMRAIAPAILIEASLKAGR